MDDNTLGSNGPQASNFDFSEFDFVKTEPAHSVPPHIADVWLYSAPIVVLPQGEVTHILRTGGAAHTKSENQTLGGPPPAPSAEPQASATEPPGAEQTQAPFVSGQIDQPEKSARKSAEPPRDEPSPEPPEPNGSRIAGSWIYTDEHGTPVLKVERCETGEIGADGKLKKQFPQSRPNGRGGWIRGGTTDIQRVPYQLPDLLAAIAARQPIFVAEGEKCADFIRELGLAATTNPGGCKVWQNELNPWFDGADVVILPDKDDEGSAHTKKILLGLSGVAARIRIVELPSLGDKEDIEQWLARGGTREKLLELVSRAPGCKAEAEPPPKDDPPGADHSTSDEFLHGREAAIALLALHFPKEGSRHHAANVIGGFLARENIGIDEVGRFVGAIAKTTGQPADKCTDMVRVARDAVAAWKGGKHPYGFTAMRDTFGDDVANKVSELLGFGPASNQRPREIEPTPFVHRDPTLIPRRKWLYGRHYVRKFLSSTLGTGGTGKTSQILVECVAMVIGRKLLDVTVKRPLRVWYWSGEDPAEEIELRLAAIIQHFELTPKEISMLDAGLFTDSGRKLPIRIADLEKGRISFTDDAPALTRALIKGKIDVLVLDPFIKTHGVSENDNSAIDLVATSFAHIADEANCAIELLHHVRKQSTSGRVEISADDGRGASSLKDAARCVRVMNTMSADEAEAAGIEGNERKRYYRVDDGKTNMTAPAESVEWFKIVSVYLPENPDDEDADPHESVGVATSWKMPGVFEGVTVSTAKTIKSAIGSGGPWAKDIRAADWVGVAVAGELGLDATNKAHKTRIKRMIEIWIKRGCLKVVAGVNPKNRHNRPEVTLGDAEW